ncbi:MAG: ATPase [Candidatus Melainabacteria bacterium GWF2_37_15]|nr:MAG: ATPase [Candidatus Melainabacteria bacterium GWF2_37_15]
MYLKRTLAKHLKKISGTFPVLLLTGPRQVGKTTLLQHLEPDERKYVTLDDPIIRSLAQEDPALFLERFKPPVLIDEIQYAPQLFPYIKMSVDKNKQPGAFWLTGSQQFHLMQNITESLAGRVGILKLQGFSQSEKNHNTDVDPFLPDPEHIETRCKSSVPKSLMQIYEAIWRGSFPAIVLNKEMDHNIFYSSYIQTYLQRDVRQITQIEDEKSFLKFLRSAAARTGQLINYADMARDADISSNTAKSWLSILEASGLIYLLEPYHTNVTKRLIKSPKLYFLDTGLCSYLTQWSTQEALEAGAMSGAILETYIMSELLKSYWHSGKQPQFYFYRDKDKKEIDLLISQNGKLYPLEFKKTASPDKTAAKNFSILNKLNIQIASGAVICLTSDYLPLTREIYSVPVWCL